jgi:hypothetical protein
MFPPKFTHPPSLRTVIDPAEPTGSDRAVDDRAAKEHSLCTCNPSRVMSNMMASKKWNGEPMGQPIAAENAFLVGCWLLDLIGYWAHPQLVIGDHDKIIVHHGVLQRWWVYFAVFDGAEMADLRKMGSGEVPNTCCWNMCQTMGDRNETSTATDSTQNWKSKTRIWPTHSNNIFGIEWHW